MEEREIPDSPPVATDDRRRRARIETRIVGWLFPSDDPHERSQAVIITDLSKLGVGFIYASEPLPGTICKLRVGLGPRRLARRLRIASSRSNSDGTYTVGGEFI
jgi:hypothetical protein